MQVTIFKDIGNLLKKEKHKLWGLRVNRNSKS